MDEPARVLDDVPRHLWSPLLQAVRRAAGTMDRTAVPALLRPFAEWQPARLNADRPRRAVAAALAEDPAMREAVGRALPAKLWTAAEDGDALRLARTHGAGPAIAALTARGRFDDVAVVAAEAAGTAADGRAVSEAGTGAAAGGAVPDGEDGSVPAAAHRPNTTAVRRELNAQRRRADSAEERARSAEASLDTARRRLTELEDEVVALRRQLDTEQRRARDRLATLRRRVQQAEARPRVDVDRVEDLAQRLQQVTDELRGAVGGRPRQAGGAEGASGPAGAPPDGSGRSRRRAPAGEEPSDGAAGGAALRRSRPATAGRPCHLPPGLSGSEPAAVTALLQVPDITVVVDGYNVSKDPRGVGSAPLPDQRAWLERIASGLVARYSVRVILVFDGDRERTAASGGGRGVTVVFTAEGETADDRIVDVVAGRDPSAPTLVVSSDREVRDACVDLGANVILSGVFLRAVG